MVSRESLGYFTMWPQGTTRPTVATLNALDGAITNKMAIVAANNTEISAYATNPTYLILDLLAISHRSSRISRLSRRIDRVAACLPALPGHS